MPAPFPIRFPSELVEVIGAESIACHIQRAHNFALSSVCFVCQSMRSKRNFTEGGRSGCFFCIKSHSLRSNGLRAHSKVGSVPRLSRLRAIKVRCACFSVNPFGET